MTASQFDVVQALNIALPFEVYPISPPPELFPKKSTWVAREADGRRILESMSWGFPHLVKVPKTGKVVEKPVTNVKNLVSPFWRMALASPGRRSLVPVTEFSENGPGFLGKLPLLWFSIPSRPVFACVAVAQPKRSLGPLGGNNVRRSNPSKLFGIFIVAFGLLAGEPALSDEYLDHPLIHVDLRRSPQFNVVGQLTNTYTVSRSVGVKVQGSAVVVAPCTIVTVYHVVTNNDLIPRPDKIYEMTFRTGTGDDDEGFFGHAKATAIAWLETNKALHEGLVLMQLSKCVGTVEGFGWADISLHGRRSALKEHQPIVAVGYGASGSAAEDVKVPLMESQGYIEGYNTRLKMLEISASQTSGASGGGVFADGDNGMVLTAIIQGDEYEHKEGNHERIKWHRGRSGVAIPVDELLQWSHGMKLIENDIRTWGKPNPAKAY